MFNKITVLSLLMFNQYQQVMLFLNINNFGIKL